MRLRRAISGGLPGPSMYPGRHIARETANTQTPTVSADGRLSELEHYVSVAVATSLHFRKPPVLDRSQALRRHGRHTRRESVARHGVGHLLDRFRCSARRRFRTAAASSPCAASGPPLLSSAMEEMAGQKLGSRVRRRNGFPSVPATWHRRPPWQRHGRSFRPRRPHCRSRDAKPRDGGCSGAGCARG